MKTAANQQAKFNDFCPTWNRQEKWQWICGLFTANVLVFASRNLMSICIVPLAEEEGWDKKQSGFVLAAFFWGYPMTQVIGGRLGDKYGADITIPLVAMIWSTLTFLTPVLLLLPIFSSTLHILVFTRVLIGLSQGFHFPGVSSLLGRNIATSERAFINSILSSGSSIGILLTGLLGPAVIDVLNWKWDFYFTGLCGYIWLGLFYFRVVSTHRKKKEDATKAEKILFLPELQSNTESPVNSVPWSLLLKSPAVIALLIGKFCEAYSFWIIFAWLPTYFHDNYPDAKPWVFNVLPWLFNIIVSILSGLSADKLLKMGFGVTFVRKLYASVQFTGVSVCLIMLNFIHTSSAAILVMTLATAFGGLNVSGTSIVSQDLAPNHAGAVYGMANMAAAIPGLIGVYISGYILDVTKSWAIVFNLAAIISQIGCFVFLIFGSGEQII